MSFDAALDHVLRWEGGAVNDPADSGGATKYGISETAHPDVWQDGPPTEEQAISIYREQYWDHERIKAGDIRYDSVAVYLFDAAVNHGPKQAARLLQKAIERGGADIAVDGWIGPETKHAMTHQNESDVLDRFVLVRVGYYRDIVEANRTQEKFLFGWLRRALDIVDL